MMTQSSPRHFLFLLSSTRSDGNSEQLAQFAARSLPDSVQQTWLHLNDFVQHDFIDRRHEGDGKYVLPEGRMHDLLDATLNATDLVFVTPLYWYNLPASAKLYLDHWAAWLRVPYIDFKSKMRGRNLWNIIVSADLDQSYAQPLVESLRFTANYMEMNWKGSLIAYGNRPGDVMQDVRALDCAGDYFSRGLRA